MSAQTFLTDPIGPLIVLLVLAFIFPLRFARKFVGIALIIVLVVYISPLPIFLLRSLESGYTPKVDGHRDAVVVLSGGMAQYIEGEDQYLWGLQPPRAIEAIRLMKKTGADYLIIVGGSPPSKDPWASETASLRRFAVEWGIPDNKILTEDQSHNTYEHTLNLKPILAAHGIHNFYLVTSGFHMRRAATAFKSAGYDFIPYPVNRIGTQSGLNWLGLSGNYISWKLAIHEYGGLLAYSFLHKL